MNIQPLFSPFVYKNLTLKNRIVMPPMTRKHSPDGIPSVDVAEYYSRRAMDAGLILSESTAIERPAAKHFKDIPNFYAEALEGWERVIRLVHQHKGVMGPQLWHVGIAKPDPSGWLPSLHFEGPDMMTRGEIQATVESFANAALNAKNLGFDCVEIHGGHGYLIDQFFWSHTNHRKDDYGGKTIGERTRFAVEVVKAIRKVVGENFVILIRLSQWKLEDYEAKNALTPNEMESWLLPLAEAGIDIFDCSQRRYWQPEFEGSDLSFAGWAKKITGQPSITVGSVGLSGEFLQSLYHGEGARKADFNELMRRYDRGEFDLVAVGRALLQDPCWIEKMRDGRYDELRDFSRESLGRYY
ncbi:12-oxophytodienoate reductase [Mucilaginibacter celer]|uniref:12-oxophytodienoate reductase n=2 Tax=Mucilaginibacter celer TaxID=2305508 RepID=A0A494W0Q1_9SPHI|nr:NADH:flavin oxidoreductase [Mucilaginibacter celer]AYL99380.1 12-oxophytodienoate reductase [Mucilaginibacter celer]